MILTATEALEISMRVAEIEVYLERIDKNIRDQAEVGEMYTTFLTESHTTALQIGVALEELGYKIVINNNSTHSHITISWDGLEK